MPTIGTETGLTFRASLHKATMSAATFVNAGVPGAVLVYGRENDVVQSMPILKAYASASEAITAMDYLRGLANQRIPATVSVTDQQGVQYNNVLVASANLIVTSIANPDTPALLSGTVDLLLLTAINPA